MISNASLVNILVKCIGIFLILIAIVLLSEVLLSEYIKRAKAYRWGITAYSWWIKALPWFWYNYFRRGCVYMQSEEYQQAVEDFDHVLRLYPGFNDSALFMNRGWSYHRLKDEEKAIRDYSQAIELNSELKHAYNNRGLSYLAIKEYASAIEDFDRAIELDSSFIWAYNNRAIAHNAMKDYLQSIRDCSLAIQLDPHYTNAYLNRGFAFSRLDDYRRATEDYQRAITLDRENVAACVSLCALYTWTKGYQQALLYADRAISLSPNNAKGHSNRGLTRYKLREYRQAIEDFNTAISLDSAYAPAYHNRGLAYLGLNDVQQALADINKSLELEPSSVCHGWMLEWTRMIETRPDEQTAERLEQLAPLDSPSVAAYNCKGVAHWIRGNYDAALAEFEQSIAKRTYQEDAYFWQGMTYASLGRDEEARAAIERALQEPFPPLLLSPLRWFEQDRPDFYASYVVPLLDNDSQSG